MRNRDNSGRFCKATTKRASVDAQIAVEMEIVERHLLPEDPADEICGGFVLVDEYDLIDEADVIPILPPAPLAEVVKEFSLPPQRKHRRSGVVITKQITPIERRLSEMSPLSRAFALDRAIDQLAEARRRAMPTYRAHKNKVRLEYSAEAVAEYKLREAVGHRLASMV